MSENTEAHAGTYIIFEGIDGSGKSSQMRRLSENLEALELPFTCLREPTNGPFGREIRERAQHGPPMSLEEEIELFIKDRRAHVAEQILPALSEGLIILQDRSFYSTVAYQGARSGEQNSLEELMRKNDFAPRPDLVFLLDLPAEEGLRRVTERGAADAFEELERLKRVRQNFRNLADKRFVTLDGMMDQDKIDEIIWERVQAQLIGANDGIDRTETE